MEGEPAFRLQPPVKPPLHRAKPGALYPEGVPSWRAVRQKKKALGGSAKPTESLVRHAARTTKSGECPPYPKEGSPFRPRRPPKETPPAALDSRGHGATRRLGKCGRGQARL